jgi:hypothetical protein
MLFEDKLAQQKEALQDIKQLADVIAAQQQHAPSLYEGANSTATGMIGSASSLSTLPPQPKRTPTGAIAAIGVALLVGGGVFWMRHEDSARQAAEAEGKGHDTAPAANTEARGSLDIAAKPDGCAIWINGDLRPETTPARIGKLPFGQVLQLKLTKEGLGAYREELTLSAAEPTRKISAELTGGSVTVVLKIDPPPTVWVDGKPWKGDRGRIEGLSAGEEHKVVVSASGFQAKTFTFSAQQGETRTFAEQLLKADANAPPAPHSAPEEKPAPAGAGPAKVRVSSKPGFCDVKVNGAAMGTTPVEAQVTSGSVSVSCKPAGGPSQQQTVQVGPGETARVSFKVDQ